MMMTAAMPAYERHGTTKTRQRHNDDGRRISVAMRASHALLSAAAANSRAAQSCLAGWLQSRDSRERSLRGRGFAASNIDALQSAAASVSCYRYISTQGIMDKYVYLYMQYFPLHRVVNDALQKCICLLPTYMHYHLTRTREKTTASSRPSSLSATERQCNAHCNGFVLEACVAFGSQKPNQIKHPKNAPTTTTRARDNWFIWSLYFIRLRERASKPQRAGNRAKPAGTAIVSDIGVFARRILRLLFKENSI